MSKGPQCPGIDGKGREVWAVEPERTECVIDLTFNREQGSSEHLMAWAEVSVGMHIGAVIVFGDTQAIADARAALIARAVAVLRELETAIETTPRMTLAPTLRQASQAMGVDKGGA